VRVVYPLAVGKGGLPHYAASLANAVAKTEDVVVLKPTETSADDAFSDDVEVVEAFDPPQVSSPDLYRLNVNPFSTLRSLYSYSNLARIESFNPDVVHDVMGLFAHIKLFTSRHDIGERYPFVVTYHELTSPRYPLSHPPMMISHLMKDLLPDVPLAAGVVHTEGQEDILRDTGYRPDRIERIPHGAYDFFTGYDYEELPTEEHTILFFGNVIKEKGIDVLIEAIPRIRQSIPDVKLIIAGDGTIPPRSREIIERYPEQFETTDGYVPNDEVGTFFSRAAAVVVPYRARDGSRGHSGALSTAFSFGKPVVATDVGHFPSLVGDSGAGVVVESGEARALADGIVDVLSDPNDRTEMAENSQKMAERLSWDGIADRHRELYERTIRDFDR